MSYTESWTKEQHAAYAKEWARNNPDKVRASANGYFKRAYIENPEKFREKWRQWHDANPEKAKAFKKVSSRKSRLKYTYGITPEQYDLMLAAQNGQCAICGDHQKNQKIPFHVDHCHATGKTRAILCNNCNTGMGMMKDNPQRLRAAADYLERYEIDSNI